MKGENVVEREGAASTMWMWAPVLWTGVHPPKVGAWSASSSQETLGNREYMAPFHEWQEFFREGPKEGLLSVELASLKV